jgi:hypothetical protein
MENIPKYPESTCSRAPSQPPPYEEIDTNWLENENVYVHQADISRSGDNERRKKKAKKEEKRKSIPPSHFTHEIKTSRILTTFNLVIQMTTSASGFSLPSCS